MCCHVKNKDHYSCKWEPKDDTSLPQFLSWSMYCIWSFIRQWDDAATSQRQRMIEILCGSHDERWSLPHLRCHHTRTVLLRCALVRTVSHNVAKDSSVSHSTTLTPLLFFLRILVSSDSGADSAEPSSRLRFSRIVIIRWRAVAVENRLADRRILHLGFVGSTGETEPGIVWDVVAVDCGVFDSRDRGMYRIQAGTCSESSGSCL